MKKVETLAKELRAYLKDDRLIDRENKDTQNTIDCINSILNKHAPIEKPFPKLMKSINPVCPNDLVFFSGWNEGVLVYTEIKKFSAGYKSNDWDMSYFKDCEIEVKND